MARQTKWDVLKADMAEPYGFVDAHVGKKVFTSIFSPLHVLHNLVMSMAFDGTHYDWETRDLAYTQRDVDLGNDETERRADAAKTRVTAMKTAAKNIFNALHSPLEFKKRLDATAAGRAVDLTDYDADHYHVWHNFEDAARDADNRPSDDTHYEWKTTLLAQQIYSSLDTPDGIERFKDFLNEPKTTLRIFTPEEKEALIAIYKAECNRIKEGERALQVHESEENAVAVGEKPELKHWKFGFIATAATAVPQGAATYAAVYGLGLIFSTYVEGIAAPIAHALTAVAVGVWFGQGRKVSGILSGVAVGAAAFAIQTWGIQALAAVCPLSELHLQLIGGAVTILFAMAVESIALATTRQVPFETKYMDGNDEKQYTADGMDYPAEFPLHESIITIADTAFTAVKAKCAACTKPAAVVTA